MTTRLPDREFDDRLDAVRDRLAETDADAAVWFGATSIEYLTGFDHIQTERPVVLAVADDRVEITVPRLEVERAEPNPRIDRAHRYFDYPGGRPIETAVEMLEVSAPSRSPRTPTAPPARWATRGRRSRSTSTSRPRAGCRGCAGRSRTPRSTSSASPRGGRTSATATSRTSPGRARTRRR